MKKSAIIINEINNYSQSSYNIHYENITFDEPSSILIQNKNGKISLTNCTFENDIYFDLTINELTLDLSNSVFNSAVHFIINKYHVKLNIPIKIYLMESTLQKGIHFEIHNTDVNIDLSKSNINGDISIFDSELNRFTANDLKSNSPISINLNNTTLDNWVEIKNSKVELFETENITVKKHFNIDKSSINYLKASDATFHGECFFNHTNISVLELNGAFCHKGLVAPYLNSNVIDSFADLSGAIFYESVFLDDSRFKSLTIKHSTFKGAASFNGATVNNIQFKAVLFEGITDFSNTIFHNGDRETFRAVKNELLKINNRVEALTYQQKELYEYEKELSHKKINGEKIMLCLNRFSNNYGTSWVQGVKFTLSIGLLTYLPFIFTLDNPPIEIGWTNWNDFFKALGIGVKYYFNFLSVFRELKTFDTFSQTLYSTIFDFLGRIFIGYGIYQTVQAFRKYGK